MAITLVQSKTANSGASAVSSLNITLDSAPIAGNTLIVGVAILGNVQVSMPNVEFLQRTSAASNNTTASLSVGRVISSPGTAIIALASGSAGGVSAIALEFSTDATRMRIDRSIDNTGGVSSTAGDSTATPTTLSADELLLGIIAVRNAVDFSSLTLQGGGADASYSQKTSIGSNSDRSLAMMYRIVSSTTTARAQGNYTPAGVFAAIALGLEKTPAGGGGGVSRGRML
jgi:hypothetical protein